MSFSDSNHPGHDYLVSCLNVMKDNDVEKQQVIEIASYLIYDMDEHKIKAYADSLVAEYEENGYENLLGDDSTLKSVIAIFLKPSYKETELIKTLKKCIKKYDVTERTEHLCRDFLDDYADVLLDRKICCDCYTSAITMKYLMEFDIIKLIKEIDDFKSFFLSMINYYIYHKDIDDDLACTLFERYSQKNDNTRDILYYSRLALYYKYDSGDRFKRMVNKHKLTGRV